MANNKNYKSKTRRPNGQKGRGEKSDYNDKRNGKIARKSDREVNAEQFYDEGSRPSMKNPNIKTARNDASWYTYSPEVLRVASAVNFNQATGVPFSDEPMHLWESEPDDRWWATSPSLMALQWTPLPGMALSNNARNATNSPLNLQMRSLYSLMQATVTQNLPFAAADLGIHLMFMDSVFMFWGHMQRLYYLFRVYKAMNTTLPSVFFKAYNLNPYNLFADGYTIADYQADMLSLQQEMRRIAVPEGFDILNRHYWMSKHVFKDSDVVRAQYYMFVPSSVWHFDAEGATGGELVLHSIPSFRETGLKGMVMYFKQLLTSYYNDENIWNLNGYILRAFNKFWTADDFQLDVVYEPQYVPEVLMQIHNATVVDGYCVAAEDNIPGDFSRIYQDSMDNVVCDPAIKMSSFMDIGHVIDRRILFDTPTDAPSEGDIMVASRLIVRGFPYQPESGQVLVRLDNFGTEVINRVFMYDGVNDANSMVTYHTNVYDEGAPGIIVPTRSMLDIARISKFNAAPMYALLLDHKNSATLQYEWGWVDYIGDIENYIVFESKTLSKLHDAAAMGEWYIKS